MQVFELNYPCLLPQPGMPAAQVMAIGDFDGVHRGHREVIGRALETARKLGIPASIMTFHPHPREILGQDKYRSILTPLPEKLEIFRELGVQYAYVVSFNEPFSRLSPQQFISDILLGIGLESVIVGFDFSFGYQGRGTPDTLAQEGHGQFAVEIVRPYQMDDHKVSSTYIRESLQEGKVDQAARLLGRPYSIQGTVVHGEARGRTIGFPTANLETDWRYVLPANGVYAIKAYVRGQAYKGVMNIGVKPTFATGELTPSLEAHLFDFQESIYGEKVRVEFIRHLRPEIKFGSVNELVEQIHRDAAQARELLQDF
ncbi:bifunctional riboflavin kinase/FAD synthetase [Paenibacillus sp. CC-CFT747]|nr:bifunctional riboflavin kinase/FAD synthetase [Paenibacillus sp. CC-CFT747]